jgi:hypothetical protein
MTSDEMVRRLQAQFGDLGDITEYQPTAETYAVNPGEQLVYGTGPSYVAKGKRLEPTNRIQSGLDGTWSTPTEFSAVLTPFDEKEGSWRSTYNEKGQMTGTPYYEVPKSNWVMDNLSTAALAALAAGVGGYGLLGELGAGAAGATGAGMTAAEAAAAALASAPEFAAAGTLGSAGAGAAGVGAAGLTAAEAAAAALANAPEFAAAGTLGSSTEAAIAALANAPEFAAANTFSNPSWYEPFAQGFQSIKDLTDVGSMFVDGPSWLKDVATGGFRNVLGQAALTGDVDLERALKAAATAGVTGFADPYLSELPKEFQPIAKAGVQTALQGGSAEDVFKGAVGSAILGPINETVAGIAGPTAAKVATSAVRGLLSSGAIDASKLTANMLGDFVGSAVAKETGDAFLGKAAATAIRSKGDLEATIKQLAMGALTTPTKKG